MITDIREGRQHAIGIILGAAQDFSRDNLLTDTLVTLRRSAESHPAEYRKGVLEVVEAAEGFLHERA